MTWRSATGSVQRRRHFDNIRPIMLLARRAFFAAFRYSWQDHEILIGYLYRLQRHQVETNTILVPAPVAVLGAINQQAVAAKVSAYAILAPVLRWFRILRDQRQVEVSADERAFLAEKLTWSTPLRWLWRKLRRTLDYGVWAANVAAMHSFARQATYDLITRDGDLDAALPGFEILTALKSQPNAAESLLDRLMLRLVPHLKAIERSIVDINPPTQPRRALVLSVVVWGDAYADLFLRCALSSLMAPGNLPGLGKYVQVIWHVFTTARLRKKLQQHPAFTAPFDARFEDIPEKLIDLAAGDGSYWLYGGLSHTSFRLAERLGADIHFLKPDTVYSVNYFANLYKKIDVERPKFVLANSFRTDRSSIVDALDAIRSADGTISLDARSLHSLGLNHIHRSSRAIIVTDRDLAANTIPQSTIFMWRNENALVIHSAHYQPAFVANELTRDLRLSYFSVDSTINRRLGQVASVVAGTYQIGPRDDIGYFEISSSAQPSIKHVDRRKYMQKFWEANTRAELALLAREFRLEIAQWPAELPTSSPSAIETSFARLCDEIRQAQTDRASANVSLTLADLVSASDTIYSLEVREGCGALAETLVEELRRMVSDRSILYKGAALDSAYLARLYINFLRLGLLNELKLLCAAHEFRLDGAAELLNAFVDLCSDLYKQSEEAGKAWSARQPEPEKFTLSCTVWGDEYVRNFMNFNARSMLAPGNLPALSKLGACKMFVVTNENGRAAIEAHPAFALASKYVEWEFAVVPQPLITELVSPAMEKYFYILYGMLDHIGIFYAQGAGSSLFMIPVDAIVADGSLANMANYRNQGFECCGGGNIVANTETFLPALEKKFLGKPAIAISTADLASLAIEHAHHYFMSQVISAENVDFGMHARELFWPIPGGVEIHSCFIHPLFVAAPALSRYKRKHYANVDYGMIPRIFNDPGRIKIVTNTDEAYINNFASSKRRFETTGSPFEFDIFLRAHAYTYPVQKALFVHGQTLRCRYNGITVNRNVAADVEVLCKRLQEARPGA